MLGEPDLGVTPEEFLRRMGAFRAEANSRPEWLFRELYIDRRFLEPYYVLMFRTPEGERGDDLGDQELFATRKPNIKMISRTREADTRVGHYWEEISRPALLNRLDNFTAMYMGDYLQPGGFRGDLHCPRERHEIFTEKRFIYKIKSPRSGVVGIGSKMFAGFRGGAVCGTVFDQNGADLDGVLVELLADNKSLTHRTVHGGLFWFSRVPAGTVKIKVKDRSCVVRVLKYEQFGALKGWLADQDGNPVVNAEVRFHAPDQEIFSGFTDASGKFATGPVPAYPAQSALLDRYPYVMSIPDFLFLVSRDVKTDDGAVGGLLKDSAGATLAGKTIILKQEGRKVAETTADETGAFLFSGLRGGRYQIEVPGSRIYATPLSAGAVEGRAPGAPLVLEIFAGDKAIGTERADATGRFYFGNMAPGSYDLRFRKFRG